MHCKKYISKLERVQKKAIRVITRSKFNAPLFRELNILKLNLYKLNVSTFLYKFVYKTLPVPLLRLYIYHGDTHDHMTRHSTDPIAPTAYSEIMRRSFLYKGPSLWLTLADPIKSSKTVFTFKKHITLSLISSY